MTSTLERSCLYCGKALRGRIDKKFCNDSCRNGYNNEQNSDSNNLMRNINYILRKNQRILQACIPEDAETGYIQKEALLRKGFQFKYHTHVYDTQKGQRYYFCYAYGFLSLENDRFLIVRQKN